MASLFYKSFTNPDIQTFYAHLMPEEVCIFHGFIMSVANAAD